MANYLRRYTAYFDVPIKTMAVKQYMEQNNASFDKATEMLGLEHGVDFILFFEQEEQL